MSKESLEASATYATLDDWIAREATPFSVDSPRTFKAAVDKVIASLGDSSEESDLLRTHPSKLHRFRLAGCPRFNGIRPRWPATATVRHQPQAVKLFDVLAAVSTAGHEEASLPKRTRPV